MSEALDLDAIEARADVPALVAEVRRLRLLRGCLATIAATAEVYAATCETRDLVPSDCAASWFRDIQRMAKQA